MQYNQPSPTDRSRYAIAAGDRSKHCRSVAPWPNRNQSYDPEIARSGVTVALSPSHTGLTAGYDLPAAEKCWNRGQIVERTYYWSQRSWMIARAKSVAARSWSCSKLLKPQSHRAYDEVTTYLPPTNVGIVGKS